MRIDGEVIKIETTGDTMTVDVQGRPPKVASWRPFKITSIDMPDNLHSRKAFHIGRRVRITVEAK